MNGKLIAVSVAGIVIACSLVGALVFVADDEKGQSDVEKQFLETREAPRCSVHEEKIGQYLMDFAEKNAIP